MIKKMFKRVCPLILALILVLGLFAVNTGAVTGKTTLIFSNNTPKVGDTLTVTVRYELDSEVNAIEGKLSFDSSVLKYLNAYSCTASGSDGTVSFNSTGNAKVFVARFDLEVISEGESVIRISEASVASDDEFSIDGCSSKIRTKNATQNNDSQDINSTTKAALKSITIASGTLTPSFDPNVTEYKVVVPYTTTDGVISCDTFDPNAKIEVEGSRQLNVGNNTRVLVITATDGTTRRYTVVFNRLDENGNDTTVAQINQETKVTVNGKEFYIGQQNAALNPPAGFALSTISYNDKEVAAYKNASGKVVLLYLIATDNSEEGLYLYNKDTGDFEQFVYITCGGYTYVLKNVTQDAPEGFYKFDYETDNKKVTAYKYADEKFVDFIIFSAISPNGNSSYYRYDQAENTIQRFFEFEIGETVSAQVDKPSVDKTTKNTIIVLVCAFVILAAALLVVIFLKNSKKANRNLRNIFDTEEEEYEFDTSLDEEDEE